VTDVQAPASPLAARVRTLVGHARAAYAGQPDAEPVLTDLERRLGEPLRVAVAGRVKAGKSTLLNALVGQPLAATDAGECTRLVTWYRHGPSYRAFAEGGDGTLEPVALHRGPDAVEIDLGGRPPESVERLVVEWPASLLTSVTLIDTPGLGSLSTEVSARSEVLLGPEEGTSPADAVIYLARHLHGEDVRFLEAFRDDDAGRPSPVNAIGVLARADEIGGCRVDALEAAAGVARRYRTDRQLRRLCQTVIPVAGLLAEGSGRLSEIEFRALGRLAEAPDDLVDEVLVSVDRFAGRPVPVDLAMEERQHLLDLLGLFGVRLARHLLRTGAVRTAAELAAELRVRSGLDDLREALATQFSARAGLLKSRAGLATLTRLLQDHPPDDGGVLATAVEEVESGTHELAELRLLLLVRSGGLELTDDENSEVERLIEGAGLAPAARLGLAPDAGPTEVHDVVATSVEQWRRRAEHPLAPPDLVAAAQVVMRSYEGLLVDA
jgi:Dynamin family